MKLVILESPYAGEIEANVTYARRALAHCLHQGEAAMASHLLYTQPGVLEDGVPAERKLGISAGLAWRQVAQLQVFYTDRGWSTGMLAALDQCLVEGRAYCIRALDGPCKLPSTLDSATQRELRWHCDPAAEHHS